MSTPGRPRFGVVSPLEALVAVYVGFFGAFSLYEATVSRPSPSRDLATAALAPIRMRAVQRPGLRGVWIDRSTLPTSRTDCARLVERLADCGINAIFPEVFSRTAAVAWPSEVAVPDEDFNSGADVLGWLVEEAHARGVLVHAWCWTMCAGTAWRPGPAVVRHPDWLGVTTTGTSVSRRGSYWLCPHNDEAMGYVRSTLLELARRYPLDGINLDYIRMEENDRQPFCACDRCRDDYFEFVDAQVCARWPPSPRDPTYLGWREGILDGFVRRLRADLRTARPGLALSACVLPLARAARRLEAQNWGGWLTEGYLDFACALTYTNRPHRFDRWAQVVAGHRGAGLDLVPSVGLHLMRDDDEAAAAQVDASLAADLGGVMLFSLRDVPPAVERALQTGGADASTVEVAALEDGLDPVALRQSHRDARQGRDDGD